MATRRRPSGSSDDHPCSTPGLIPDRDIYDNIRHLLDASGRRLPPLDNVPNRYLHPKAR